MGLSTFDKISLFLSELTATGLLVFLGCMGCIKTDHFPNTHLQMTLNFGLVVMILVQSFGCVSGAHMNPAVSVAAVIYEIITPAIAALYAAGQLIGGVIGYGLLLCVIPSNVVFPPDATHAMCVTFRNPDITVLQAVSIEFILTMVLILVCCGVWDPRNDKRSDSAAIKFGLTVASLAVTGGSFTGTSMNPARSIGPALWNADFEDHWVYWVGPMAAGLSTAVVYKNIFWRQAIVYN